MSNILKGLLSGGFGVAVSLIAQIALVPLFLHTWGSDRYALWIILFSAPLYLSVSDFGIINVMMNKALRYFSICRLKLFSSYIGTAFVVVFVVSTVLSAVIFCFLYVFSPVDDLEFPIFTLVGLAIYSCLLMLANLVVACFRSIRKFHFGSFCLSGMRLVDLIVMVSVLALGGGELFISALLALTRLALIFVFIIFFFKTAPAVNYNFKFQLLKMNFATSIRFFLIPFSTMSMNQGLLFVIGLKFSAENLILFNSLRIMFRMVTLGVNVMSSAWRQEVSHSFYGLDHVRYFRLKRTLVLLSVLLVLLGGLFFGWGGERVLRLWLNVELAYSSNSFFLILIMVLFNSLSQPDLMLVSSLNRHDLYAYQFLLLVFVTMFFVLFQYDFETVLMILVVSEITNNILLKRSVWCSEQAVLRRSYI